MSTSLVDANANMSTPMSMKNNHSEGFKNTRPGHIRNNPGAIVLADNEEVVQKEKRRRPSIRCGCNAYLLVKKINGNQYQVDQFEEKHNHSMVDNNDVQFLRAHRQLTYTQKDLLHKISHANLGPVKGFKLLKHMYGSFSNIGATVEDCKNFRKDMQKFIGDRDAQMVVEKLLSKRDFNPGFSMDYLTDSSNKLIGLFWADEESKRSYFTFGDVVSFDATFDSNKYKMVFVPFTGIDNHNRCVTFGAGLISKEDLVSYNWLLESFLKAFGKPPKIVVTDQDLSMKSAIKEIFPDSRHRLCMWHIMQKLSTKLTNANLTLVEFLSHFETAMDVQRYNQSKHDHESRYTTPDFKTELLMEKHAAHIFTRTIFFDIQDEMHRALMHCHSYNVKDVDDFKMVEVHETKEDSKKKENEIDEPPVEKKLHTYNVLFRKSDVTVSCSCKRYESYGLLCRHVFLVLKMFNIKSFPNKYILRRWTREALPPKSDESKNKVQQLSQQSAETDSTIRAIFYSVEYTINRLVGDMDKLSMYGDTLKQLMKQADSDVPIPLAEDKNAMMSSMLGVTEPKKVDVENPDKSKNKGSGQHKRLKSGKEISMIKSQKIPRTCGNCGKKEGHNIKTCPHKPAASTS
uniref:protein FAR1-RELATED SEQUENCE 5-like n=1 Tax=Erigeron canadensis TaxID=72917 RepID=UPI001CB8BEE2|nr:protein FAR1-RELATED SEQUENCE 5-like [Erigeron canadensis]